MNNINSEVYSDISIIISMMPVEMRKKISNSFINFIENNKSNNYVSNINPKIPIKEQNIRKETKEILGIIYRDYLCTYEERNNLIREEQKEIRQFEEKLRQKYNLDDIFKNKSKKDEKNIQFVNEKRITIIEEKWYKKVWKFLTKLFIK